MDDARFELNSKIRAYFQSFRNFSFSFYNSTAILFEKNGDVRFKNIPLPSPSKNECTIIAENTFISPGTELAQLNKLPNAKISYPFNPGYSGSGVVIRAGRATGYKKNQRVCGLIPHASISNVDHRNLFKIPNNSDPKTSSLVTFAIIILRSLEKEKDFSKKTVAVFGQGILGQLLIPILRDKGVGKIIAITRSKSKHSLSISNGADLCFSLNDNIEKTNEINADIIFDVTPDPDAIKVAISVAKINARIILLGSSRGVCRSFPLQEITEKNIVIEGAHARLGLLEEKHKIDLVEQFFKLTSQNILSLESINPRFLTQSDLTNFYYQFSKGKKRGIGYLIDWGTNNDTKKNIIFTHFKPLITGLNKNYPKKISHSVFPYPKLLKYNSKKKIKYALIGCGEIGLSNAKAILSSDNSELVYAVDNNLKLASDISKIAKCKYSLDFSEALNNKIVDACFICTPHHLHTSIATQALENNIHTIVEKPLSNDYPSAKSFYDLANDSNLRTAIAFMFRYDNNMILIKQLIEDGLIGKIVGIEFSLKSNKKPSYWTSGNTGRAQNDWRKNFKKSGGGIVTMQLCHHFDIIRYLTGLEIEITNCDMQFEKNMEVESAANVNFRLENGALGTMKSTYLSHEQDHKELIIIGDEGQVDVYNSSFFTVNSRHKIIGNNWYKIDGIPKSNMREGLISDFSNSILNNTQPRASLINGLRAQKLLDDCYKHES